MPSIKNVPEDFVVEELPAYEPSGDGEHFFVRFTKRDLTTDVAVSRFARALDVRVRDVGVAGLKDKVAVTTQTISFPFSAGMEEKVASLALEGITVLDARRHGNKLKTGHLHGNRFAILIKDIAPAQVDGILETFVRIAREGIPNAYGEQRFGRAGDNAARARRWLSGKEAAPRDPRQKRLLWSSLQSAMFNEVLARRVTNGTWATCLAGDLVKRCDSGGLFLCTDVPADQERALRGEVSATGPMFGLKMRDPEGEPYALEQGVLAEMLGDDVDMSLTKSIGEGTRRALRLWVEELKAEREQDDSIRVYFVLPKGAYATTVISSAIEGISDPPVNSVPTSGDLALNDPGPNGQEFHD